MTTDKDYTVNDDKPLRGYRIGIVKRLNEKWMREAGADLLRISRIPAIDRNYFYRWWKKEVQRAIKDQLQLVVVKSSSSGDRMNLLEIIEEKEWYDWEEGPTRIRFTTYSSLMSTMFRGEELRDNWGDIIEKGKNQSLVAAQSAYSLGQAHRWKRQVRITRYIQHRFVQRERKSQLRITEEIDRENERLERLSRVIHQTRITCYFRRMNR